MIPLKPWKNRPAEEANLFNPAFVASLIYEFVKEFEEDDQEGVPITFAPVCLAIVLHAPTRKRLPYSTITSLYEWVHDNEDILVEFHSRVMGLMPFLREALLFAYRQRVIRFGEGHLICMSERKAHFSAGFLRETSAEVEDVIKSVKFIARWFLKSGSETSILACWGVRP